MAQKKLNTIQIVHTPHYEKLFYPLIQTVHLALIWENDMLQIKDMFKTEATWPQFSPKVYLLILWFQLEDTVLLFGTLLLFDPALFPKHEA